VVRGKIRSYRGEIADPVHVPSTKKVIVRREGGMVRSSKRSKKEGRGVGIERSELVTSHMKWLSVVDGIIKGGVVTGE